ncbi:MAG: 50S ribosomal protein L25/general stress protein Ctc [Gammaproteobacteria bacterium]|nr:MAG: 50S ribosomal protein L25/general stress protein Ctc [Gammaproteobacteria bacterium]
MSEELFVIKAELRDESGKGASRRLRHKGKVPAILYGDGKKPQSLTLDHNEIIQHLEHEAFYSHILTLVANGKKQRAIVRDIQRHAFKPKIMHMDFQRINSRTKLTVHVPLHFLNEDICIGFKAGGIISHQINELEVSCFPKDLPEFIEVDLAALDIGDSVHISEVTLPKDVVSVALSHGDESHDSPVASILHRGGAEETEVEEAATDEVESTDDDAAETNED